MRYKDEDGGGRVVEVLSRTGFVVDREREMMGIGDGEEEVEVNECGAVVSLIFLDVRRYSSPLLSTK